MFNNLGVFNDDDGPPGLEDASDHDSPLKPNVSGRVGAMSPNPILVINGANAGDQSDSSPEMRSNSSQIMKNNFNNILERASKNNMRSASEFSMSNLNN